MAINDDPDLSSVRQHTLAIAAIDRVQADHLLRKGRHIALARHKLSPELFGQWLETIAMPPATAALLERAADLFAFDGADQIHAAAMLVLAAPDVHPHALADARRAVRIGRVVNYA
jgi:hypothetical protein